MFLIAFPFGLGYNQMVNFDIIERAIKHEKTVNYFEKRIISY